MVTACDSDGNATLSLRNKFSVDDKIEVVGPDVKPFTMTVNAMQDAEGNALEAAIHPEMVFTMKLPRAVPPMSFLRHAVELSAKD